MLDKKKYLLRIFTEHFTQRNKSQLSFWYEKPEINNNFTKDNIGEYYMVFSQKADYKGPFDQNGVPLLDYKGDIGKQYNPIAIAQYGLGNYNKFKRTENEHYKQIFLKQADWLVSNMEKNKYGLWVWNHKFDWPYYKLLRAPWYSGLAQGQCISLLVRAHHEQEDSSYLECAQKAYLSFEKNISEGGVICYDNKGNTWIEEYILNPPTHILNGFIWALWGVYDYFLTTKNNNTIELFWKSCGTLEKNLRYYDIKFWSLYDLSKTRIKNIASNYYHSLHIAQLEAMHLLTGKSIFKEFAQKWEKYQSNIFNRTFALAWKIVFKLLYF